MKREFWTVEIRSHKYESDRYTYHVFATSAAKAEKRALECAKLYLVEKPFCYSAMLGGYVE